MTIVDLGLVSCNELGNVGFGSVVGPVFGRQPQELPSSLHYVLRLRRGW